MSIWEHYAARTEAFGRTKRDRTLQRERRYLRENMGGSLSYQKMIVNGEDRQIAVISSDDLSKKMICSLPGEDFPHGGVVDWVNSHWLITGRDPNTEVYTRGVIRRCNHLLKWIADDGAIVERWCIVEDGTNYLLGEFGDNAFIMTRGDTRIAVTLPKDDYTIRLNRKNRFLVDDIKSPTVLAYELTKPFKLGEDTFGDDGVMHFIFAECNTEDSDNFDLRIANYYDYFPKESDSSIFPDSDEKDVDNGKKVWF